MVANNLVSDLGRFGYKLTPVGAAFFKGLNDAPYTEAEMDAARGM